MQTGRKKIYNVFHYNGRGGSKKKQKAAAKDLAPLILGGPAGLLSGVMGIPITLPTASVKRVAEQAKEEMAKPAAEKEADGSEKDGGDSMIM